MAKEDTLERNAGERENPPSKVVEIFREHFDLALKSMSAEHAAASAHDAVQRHLASRATGGVAPNIDASWIGGGDGSGPPNKRGDGM